MLSRVPRRDVLALLFPLVVGAVLLIAGAQEARNADAWDAYVVVASAAFTVPLAYTLFLARRGRLFLRDPQAIESNRAAIVRARPVGFIVGALAVAAIGIAAGSIATVLYAAFGGAALGIWPGIAANFWRLRRGNSSRD
jgi:hypothetical protein